MPKESYCPLRRLTRSNGASYGVAIDDLVGARKSAGLSQRQLADLLGKPRSFISKLENRERRLDVVEFIALPRALGLAPADVMNQLSELLPRKVES